MADDQIQFETLLNTLLNPENEIRTKAEVMYLTYIRLFELKDMMFVSFSARLSRATYHVEMYGGHVTKE